MSNDRIKVSLESHQARIQRALEFQNKASQLKSDASVKVGDEKVQYFEKIALGSGAAITAIVSFVGANSANMHTPRLLKWALLMLFVTLALAMLRNWIFPFYTVGVWARHKGEADQQVEDLEALMFEDYPETVAIDETNTIIPVETHRSNLEQRSNQRRRLIKAAINRENWLFRIVIMVETASLVSLLTAAILLVIGVWLNVGIQAGTQALHQSVTH
jgi:hypothetical protein